MFWQEDDKKDVVTASDRVIDLNFRIECKQIPTCHAWELSQALYSSLPWIRQDPEVGIHQIHGAASGNGWERPADGELIQLSRRARMSIRIPVTHVDEAGALAGQTLDIAGYPVKVGQPAVKKIEPIATLFARYVVVDEGASEEDFLQWVVSELESRDIEARKLLCGMAHEITANGESIHTRSLMIADLEKQASIDLQEQGIGPYRHYGCGIFIPHKGIKAVSDTQDK